MTHNRYLSERSSLTPHLDLPALLLHKDHLVVFVVPLCALRTHRCMVLLTEHRQWLVVVPAQVTGWEGGWICEPVSLKHRIPQVGREVNFTVGHLADKARLHRRQFGPVADITGNDFFFSLGPLVLEMFRNLHKVLLSYWSGQRPFKFELLKLAISQIKLLF